MSRGWCFNASFVYDDNPLHTDMMRTLFGREPRRHKTSHSHWFYELFSLLWKRGYYPETFYYTQLKSVRLQPDLNTARRLARFLLEEDEADETAVRKVLDYLEKHADGNGAVTEDSECRYGWLIPGNRSTGRQIPMRLPSGVSRSHAVRSSSPCADPCPCLPPPSGGWERRR